MATKAEIIAAVEVVEADAADLKGSREEEEALQDSIQALKDLIAAIP